MCTPCEDPRIHRPLVSVDIFDLKRYYSKVDATLIDKICAALTDWNSVTPVVPTVIVEMVHRFQIGDNGSFQSPTLPFSAMALKTGERLQAPEMVQCHHVFESLILAQRNVELLQDVLRQHGMQLVFFCDCGCKIIAADTDPYDEEYLRVNAYRSYWEAVGSPVILVESFDSEDWKERRLDMGPSEVESYRRVALFLKKLPRRSADMPSEAVEGLDHLKKLFPCKCGHSSCGSTASVTSKSALA